MDNKKIIEYFQKMVQLTANPTAQGINQFECQETMKTIIKESKSINPFSFYVITNLQNQSITWSYGLNESLGYGEVSDSEPLLITDYFKWIHPDHIELYVLYGAALYGTITYSPEIVTRSQFQYYGISLAIKHKNEDTYYKVYQRSLPFEMGRKKELISHLNIYTILGVHDESEKLIYPFFKTGIFEDFSFHNKFFHLLNTVIIGYYELGFSRQEQLIINAYLEHNDQTIADIAERLKLKPSIKKGVESVKNSQKAILQKLNKIYRYDNLPFKSVVQKLHELKLLHPFEISS